MDSLYQRDVYPNPDVHAEWHDASGRTWTRRGARNKVLAAQRVRRLLRDEEVPLITWAVGAVTWHRSVSAKSAAADELYAAAEQASDVVATEWKGTDGEHLLLLVHNC